MSITKHEARALIRKAVKRVPEGEEIRHLNIMPMMDIMTILLVAFIMTASEATPLSVGDVQLPPSQTNEEMPEKAVTLTIARGAILVEGEPILTVKNGTVDASDKQNGALGIVIPKLSRFLGRLRNVNEQDLLAQGKAVPKKPEILIVADKSTPYRLLLEVLTSSRTEEAGYRRFRLIVLEQGGAPAPASTPPG
jgi:biopolymer transport protein ExbD